jgi:serine phosphatase RsbU (regulator of sigma subunit)
MLAALIVGAIRTAFKFTSKPGEIMALLNERLQGRGLVTCMALRIDRDGSAELANAGHLPPYINGKEMAVEGTLPLGALPGIAFRTMRFELAAGEAMVLVSDGVVEARNASGELFGFERTREMSRQSAEKIAEAAQQFGQEDDITVLTLSLVPAAVVNA